MGTQPRQAETARHAVILRTNDDGGSLTLRAQMTPTGWAEFTLTVEERPVTDLAGEDAGCPADVSTRTSAPARTWAGALGLLDGCVWEILHPDFVHPAFRQMVISAVRERAADPDNACAEFIDAWLPSWEKACSAS